MSLSLVYNLAQNNKKYNNIRNGHVQPYTQVEMSATWNVLTIIVFYYTYKFIK